MAIGKTAREQLEDLTRAMAYGEAPDILALLGEALPVAKVLLDQTTHGLISCEEAGQILPTVTDPEVRKLIDDLVANPPFIARARGLAKNADAWFSRSATCVKASDDFMQYLKKNSDSIKMLQKSQVRVLLDLANDLSEHNNPLIQENGRRARAHILRAFFQTQYSPLFCGAVYYTGGRRDVEIPQGMEVVVDNSVELMTTDPEIYFLSTEAGKDWHSVRPRDLYSPGEKVPCEGRTKGKKCIFAHDKAVEERALPELNERAGCRKPKGSKNKKDKKGKKKTELSSICYTHDQGQLRSMVPAFNAYFRLQPHLESIFASEGVDPRYSILAISESKMGREMENASGAFGHYQIMPGNIKPQFGIYADRELDYDERGSVFIAARAAARMLRMFKEMIMVPGFVEGLEFSAELASVMATSAYHAGQDTLRNGLIEVKKDLELERLKKYRKEGGPLPKKVTGQDAFAFLITSPKFAGAFKKASKNYPARFLAVERLVYGKDTPPEFEALLEREAPVEDLSIVGLPEDVGGFLTLEFVAKLIDIDASHLAFLNTHIGGRRRKGEKAEVFEERRIRTPIAANSKKAPKLRLIIPTRSLLTLEKALGVGSDRILSERVINLEALKKFKKEYDGSAFIVEGPFFPPSGTSPLIVVGSS